MFGKSTSVQRRAVALQRRVFKDAKLEIEAQRLGLKSASSHARLTADTASSLAPAVDRVRIPGSGAERGEITKLRRVRVARPFGRSRLPICSARNPRQGWPLSLDDVARAVVHDYRRLVVGERRLAAVGFLDALLEGRAVPLLRVGDGRPR